MTTISPKLIEAYRKARYVVLPDIVFHVGEASAPLDALLDDVRANCAAFVTAANPRSQPRSKEENAAALAELDRQVAAAGHDSVPGEGREPDGTWAEPSRLVLGIDRAAAEALGRRFGQNAIVFIEKGRAPELVLLG
jgi:glycine/D-amino acid oxidase-like deaminating enzyme